MNKIQIMMLLIWSGAGILLLGATCYYFEKYLTKSRIIAWGVSVGVILLWYFSVMASHQRYGISILTLVHSFLIYTLLMISIHDIIEQTVPLEWLIFGALVGIVFLTINPNLRLLETVFSTLLSIGAMLLLTIMTRGGIGTGDAGVIALLTLILGWEMALGILLISFLLIGSLGFVLLLLKKVSKKTTLPFIPFILLVVLILEWV